MTTTATTGRDDARLADDRYRRQQRRQAAADVFKHAGLILLAVVMIYPLIWLLVSSFKPTQDIFRDLSIFTTHLTTENYTYGWTALRHPFTRYLLNSLLISVLAIVGNLFSCSLAAYAFARLKFRGRNFYFAIMLMTIMLPFHVVLVPQFLIFKQLNWLNTILPLVVLFTTFSRQFIRGLSRGYGR